MAVDMFLKIETIEGEAKDHAHEKEIDVLAWSWGMSQSGTTHVGGGGGSGKVNVQDMSFTKYIDNSSHALMLACCNGEHIGKCQLTVRKAGKDPVEYYRVVMEEVMVTSVSTGGSGGEDRLTENVTLNFSRASVIYKEQNEAGDDIPEKAMGWNIKTNEPAEIKPF